MAWWKQEDAAKKQAALKALNERVAILEGVNPPTAATIEQLRARVTNLEKATAVNKDDQKKQAYQHAGEWVRMVNTITWTLTSIYLVGAIIALNGASQTSVDRQWVPMIGWCVFALCGVWLTVDAVYERTAMLARRKLELLESGWEEDFKFYSGQTAGESAWRRWLLVASIFAPIIGVGGVALFGFALK